jgi:hypothetical protein
MTRLGLSTLKPSSLSFGSSIRQTFVLCPPRADSSKTPLASAKMPPHPSEPSASPTSGTLKVAVMSGAVPRASG